VSSRLASSSLLAAAALALVPAAASAQAELRPGVTGFPAAWFAKNQPASAFDMVSLLPGFRLIEGDSAVRGYSGSRGDVLIDGQPPPNKDDTLEDALKRIPADQVDHVELIRSGAAGVDMQGYALLANVVLDRRARLGGRIEAQDASFAGGYSSPRAAGELSWTAGPRSLDLSAAYSRLMDDEHGFGSRNRYAADGRPLKVIDYGQAEGVDVLQLGGAWRQPLAGGALRLTGLFKDSRMFANIAGQVTYPAPDALTGAERAHTRVGEGAARYERSFGATGLELLASYRRTDVDARDRSADSGGAERSVEQSSAGETILRGVLRRTVGPVALEVGAEGALNTLDSDNRLFEDEVETPLPGADVGVRETRAELFATGVWRVRPDLTLETGLRYETSRLSQSGDVELSKSLAFWKPRARLAWAATPNDELRLLVEREVGQLDFADFVGVASLTEGTVTAGNKDLVPDSLWRVEAAIEHRIGEGSVVLSARREWISNLVDRLPVAVDGEVFDAVGNIGEATRDEVQLDAILPLDRWGLAGVTVKGDVLVRRSRVVDPTTGETRHISGDAPVEASLGFTHDVPRWRLRWGANYVFAAETRQFKVAEVQTDLLQDRLDLFVEVKPTARWTLRAFAKNVTDTDAVRTRLVYDAVRSPTSFAYREQRILSNGPYVGLTAQFTFGR
jgi:outer membrane receptor protein involved in Fe transport